MVVNPRSEAMKRLGRNHGAAFKVQVASAAVKGEKTLAELVEQFGVPLTLITEWKLHVLARAVDVFGGTKSTSDAPDLKFLHAKIGQLALENDFLEGALIKSGMPSTKQ
jgi:transposase